MADEREAGTSPEFTPEDEIDELFARANANPTRAGCPAHDVLIALAHKRRPISDPAYEHLAKCSACYREFRGFQQAPTHWMSRRKAAWVAAAAALKRLQNLQGLRVVQVSRRWPARHLKTPPENAFRIRRNRVQCLDVQQRLRCDVQRNRQGRVHRHA